ncbi:MAG: phosphoglycerate mutase family protein [Nitriliruptoraceae bacterium]
MTVLLLRHAEAGDRWLWSGNDRDRPLDDHGVKQATELATQFAEFAITRVQSSPFRRCVQTVEPLAASLSIHTETEPQLAEGSGSQYVRDMLATSGDTTIVLCTHGDIIAAVLGDLERHGCELGSSARMQKASTWQLDSSAPSITARYLPPPC